MTSQEELEQILHNTYVYNVQHGMPAERAKVILDRQMEELSVSGRLQSKGMKKNKTKNKTNNAMSSLKILVAAALIIITIGIVSWYAIVEPIFVHQPFFTKHGCTPTAWTGSGIPTMWRCPAGTGNPPL